MSQEKLDIIIAKSQGMMELYAYYLDIKTKAMYGVPVNFGIVIEIMQQIQSAAAQLCEDISVFKKDPEVEDSFKRGAHLVVAERFSHSYKIEMDTDLGNMYGESEIH